MSCECDINSDLDGHEARGSAQGRGRRHIRLFISSILIVAVFIAVAVVGEISKSTSNSSTHRAFASTPTPEADVPASIPSNGVDVGSWQLMPSSTLSNSSSNVAPRAKGNISAGTLITGVEAIIKATGWSSALVAALMGKIQVTPVEFSIPGITHYSGGNVINNPSVWIVTLPITPMQNPLIAVGDHPGMPQGFKVPMVSHINYAVDASTGQVLSELWTQ